MPRAFKLSGVTFSQTGLPNLFDPSFLGANLLGWWAADQGVTVNGSNQVTAWNDLSGAGNTLGNATPGSALVYVNPAQNNLPAMAPPNVSHTGTGYWLQTPATVPAFNFAGNTPFSLYTVFRRQPEPSGLETILCNNPSIAFGGWQFFTGNQYGGTMGFKFTSSTGAYLVHGSTVLQTGVAYNIVLTYSGGNTAANLQIYVNGVAETMTVVTNTTLGTITNGPLIVGGYGGNFVDSDYICEAAITNDVLTAAQIASLNTYATQKWAA